MNICSRRSFETSSGDIVRLEYIELHLSLAETLWKDRKIPHDADFDFVAGFTAEGYQSVFGSSAGYRCRMV